MEVALRFTCFVLLVFGFAQSSVLPVEKCTLTDKTCMVAAVQKMVPVFTAGMPEHGIEVLDPMDMGDLKFDLSGLQFSLSGGICKGLKNAVINDVKWDTKKKIFTIDFDTDMSVKGQYTAAGRVLILPITGDGQLKLKLKKLHVKLLIHFEMEKDHVKPTKYGFEFDVKENAHFHLTNLFNGNKELSEAMLNFLNENWKQISVEFGKPLVDNAAKIIYKNIAIFFEKMPIAEIANV